ncbi:sulfatase-like hydrolase/transferase [uncultured Winogradskyella sp.]|uniref:sulfatase-like hydrolase/transferase n=1 Tax=uncultured Winogradskyella sp. TaxID=395353 RepID=UPI00261CCB12|nr:sulfatase-like hydrolase/transferase [uncultured Winogradskyella sp.]
MTSTLIFILSFLGINFLVFIPYWLIGQFAKIDYPKKSFFDETPYFFLKKILYQRYSDDFFRLIFELQILTLLLLTINENYTSYLKIPFIIVTTLSFVYITYISVIIKIFKKEPMLLNDIDFAKTGIMVYKKKIPVAIITILICMTLVVFLSYSLSDILIYNSKQIKGKWVFSSILIINILVSLYSIKKVSYSIYHSCVSFSLIKHFIFNLKKCITLKQSLKTLNNDTPYNYTKNITLKNTPNVILIFLESYGSFALSDEKYGIEIKKKLNDINTSINTKNYKTVSTLSKSPISSGGSWLSHSSILFGAKVKDIAAHEVIFSHTDYASNLESLPKFLDNIGYQTTMSTTLSYDKNEVDWQKIKNTYPFDHLMLYDDFNYRGNRVPIFGDRFSLPDEYSLNYAYHSLLNSSPYFLCVSTINSHYNYISPIKTLNHWEDYNTEDFKLTDGLKKNNLKNYFTAIHYQLDYIHKFLLNNDLENTIMVLIGDHQPPFITPADIDKSTPIHVIAKNNDFINAFKEFNFTQGLVPNQQTQKHESFFSKFLYAINKVYGENKKAELPIFEDGIHLY